MSPGAAAGGADRARDQVGPGVDVAQRVADDGRLAGRARRRVDAGDALPRHGEAGRTDSGRAGRSSTVNGKRARSASVRQVVRMHALGLEGLPVVRHVARRRACRLQRSRSSCSACSSSRLARSIGSSSSGHRAFGGHAGSFGRCAPAASTGITVRPLMPPSGRARARSVAPSLVGHDHVVDAGAAAARDLGGVGREHVAALRRRQELDRQPGGDRDLVVRELQANAKAESASVVMKPPWQMSWPFSMSSRTRHLQPRRAGADREQLHAEAARGAVGGEHVPADGVRRRRRRRRGCDGCG